MYLDVASIAPPSHFQFTVMAIHKSVSTD